MPKTIDRDVRNNARILWDYHCLDLGLRPADFILALGSHDERVAEQAASLWLAGLAPLLVTSGGVGKVTRTSAVMAEGDRFALVARRMGVPSANLIVENTASNTGENITRTRDLIATRGIAVRSGILVTKPYMRRRAFATAARQWPEVDWLVSSPEISFDEYPRDDVPEEQMIDLMVGDLQRMDVYSKRGFQISQEIPSHVWKSYQELVDRGFDKYVIKGEE